MRQLFESSADQMPFCRRFAVVLPRRRHRPAAPSRHRCPVATPPLSCCAAAVPLRYRRHTALPPSFCRGACDASMCSRRLQCWHVSSATAFRQIVRVDNARHPGYSLCNLSIACQNAWFFPSLPECFRLFSSSSHSPLLSVCYLGRTTEKMIRRCSVREEAFKPCNSGQGASWDCLASEGASRLRTAERGRENRRKRVIQSAKPKNGKGGEPIIRRTLSECGGCSSGLSYDGKLAQ